MKAHFYPGRIGIFFIVVTLIVQSTGCDRSEMKSEWLLQQYLQQRREEQYDHATSTLLFLRARYSSWPAGKIASLLLTTEGALARSRYLHLSKTLPDLTPYLLTPRAIRLLKDCYHVSDSENLFGVLDSIYIPRKMWKNRCLYYPNEQILGTLEQGSLLRLWDLNSMEPVFESRLGETPVLKVIAEAGAGGFYIFLLSDTSGVFLNVRQKRNAKPTPFITRLKEPQSFEMKWKNLFFTVYNAGNREFEIHRSTDGKLIYADYQGKNDPFILIDGESMAYYDRETGLLNLTTHEYSRNIQFLLEKNLDLSLEYHGDRKLLFARSPGCCNIVDLESPWLLPVSRIVLTVIGIKDLFLVDGLGKGWFWKHKTRELEPIPALERFGRILDVRTVVSGLAVLHLAGGDQILYDFLRATVLFTFTDSTPTQYTSFPGNAGVFIIDGGGNLSCWSRKEGLLTIIGFLQTRNVVSVEPLSNKIALISYRDGSTGIYNYAENTVSPETRNVVSVEPLSNKIALISYRDSSTGIYNYAEDTVLADLERVEAYRYFPVRQLLTWVDGDGNCRLSDLSSGFKPVELSIPAARLALVLDEPFQKGLLLILDDGFLSVTPGGEPGQIFTPLEPNPYFTSGRNAWQILDLLPRLEVDKLKKGSHQAHAATEGEHLRLTFDSGETLFLWHHRAPSHHILLPPRAIFISVDDRAMVVAWSKKDERKMIQMRSPHAHYNRTLNLGKPIKNLRMMSESHSLLFTLVDNSQIFLPYSNSKPLYRSSSTVKLFTSDRYQKTLVGLDDRVLVIPHSEPDNYTEPVRDSAMRQVEISKDAEFLAWIDSTSVLNLYKVGAEDVYVRIGDSRQVGQGIQDYAISPDSRLLAVRAEGSSINIFNLWTGKWYRKLTARAMKNSKLFFTYGSLLLDVNTTNAVCYDVEYGRKVFRFEIPREMHTREIGLSPDGNTLICKERYRNYSFSLAEIFKEYLRQRTISAEWTDSTALARRADKMPLWLSVDTTLIPATERMVRVLVGSAGSQILVDKGVLNSRALQKFKLAGGYTVPKWWSTEGLSYTLAKDKLSDLSPSSVTKLSQARAGEEVLLNWYEARALACYMGKELPTVGQWEAALAAGVIDPVIGQAWDWCLPADTSVEQGYEKVWGLFKYPLKSPAAPSAAQTTGPHSETWLVPGYFKENAYARLVLK